MMSDLPSTTPIVAEQAIFTSIRSPMGEGYRIVAASPGLRPEEKAEITRLSPSHNSLCTGGAVAEAIATYPLATGRQCIAYSQHAGTEHTARGGQRVFTHILILDREDFNALGANPFRAYAGIPTGQAIAPSDSIPSSLPPVTLEPPGREFVSAASTAGLDIELLCAISSAISAGCRLVVAGVARPLPALEWALLLTPRWYRRKLSASAGLRFSTSRPMQLVFVDRDMGETARAIAGQRIQLWDVQQPEGHEKPAPAEWFDLLRRLWHERRHEEIARLTMGLSTETTANDLRRVAALCEAIDELPEAPASRVEELRCRYARATGTSPTEVELLTDFWRALNARRDALAHENPENQGCPAVTRG